MVKLESRQGKEQSFDPKVAEKILNMKYQGGWLLPKGSDYSFVGGKLTKKKKKKEDSKADD